MNEIVSPVRRQAIIWINAVLLTTGSLGTQFQWNSNKNKTIIEMYLNGGLFSSRPQYVKSGNIYPLIIAGISNHMPSKIWD